MWESTCIIQLVSFRSMCDDGLVGGGVIMISRGEDRAHGNIVALAELRGC